MSVQDGRNSQKKAWKAFQANYDDVFSLSDRMCSYCLTDQMVQAMLTMTEYLKWPTRWISTEGEIDSDLIDAFASKLEYQLMSGCCDDNLPIQYRYSAAGILQQSLNGGGTWTDAPNFDPRIYSPQFPPIPGDDGPDKKCIAATGAAALVKEQIGDQLTDDMSRYTLSQLITDWVGTMIESSNPFQALLTVVTNQIFALVIAVLKPALTDDVYDKFKCILYCSLSDDATVNEGAWATIRSDILSDIAGIAGIFLEHLVFLLGSGGLTNLVRAGGATTGDCSDCTDCGDCVTLYEAGDPGVPLVPDEDCGYTIPGRNSGPTWYIYLSPDESGIPVLGKTFKFTYENADGASNRGWYDIDTNPHFGNAPADTCITGIFYENAAPFTVGLVVVDC